MLADTYTLNGITFTKRYGTPDKGALYTNAADILNQKRLLIKYQADRKGVIRTLIDLSTNVPDTDNTKVLFTRRVYANLVTHPQDVAADIDFDMDTLGAIFAHATLPGLIQGQTL